MKCLILFSRNNNKNSISLLSAEFALSVVSIKIALSSELGIKHSSLD